MPLKVLIVDDEPFSREDLRYMLAGHQDFEVIVVDDASSDGTADAVTARHPGVIVATTDGNIGFSRAVNLGAERATGDILLVLNSDT